MAKQTSSYRASEETSKKMNELGILFRENSSELIERAINYLYKYKEQAAKEDLEERLSNLNKINTQK